MTFDSNLAWRQASAAVSANRDVVLPLAGVFFLLPQLAAALLLPDPPSVQGLDSAARALAAQAYYHQIIPYLLPIVLVQAVGTLSILTLFTDRTRPTVAEAIKLGARGLLPYLGAQILFALVFGLVGGGLVMLAALARSSAAIGLAVLIVAVAAVAAYGHLVLVAPVVAVERIYSPLAALRRSWAITRGHALRVLGFLLLIALVVVVAVLAAQGVVGAVAGLIGGAEAARVAGGVTSGVLGAAVTLYMAAVLAAIHQQLAPRHG